MILMFCFLPSGFSQAIVHWFSKRWSCLAGACEACIGFCRVDRDADDPDEPEEEHVSPGCGTPASIETPLQSSVSRCTSLNVIRDPLAQTPTRRNDSVISPVQTQSSNPSQPVASAAPTVATTSASGANTSGGNSSTAGGGGGAGGGGNSSSAPAPTAGATKEGKSLWLQQCKINISSLEIKFFVENPVISCLSHKFLFIIYIT